MFLLLRWLDGLFYSGGSHLQTNGFELRECNSIAMPSLPLSSLSLYQQFQKKVMNFAPRIFLPGGRGREGASVNYDVRRTKFGSIRPSSLPPPLSFLNEDKVEKGLRSIYEQRADSSAVSLEAPVTGLEIIWVWIVLSGCN